MMDRWIIELMRCFREREKAKRFIPGCISCIAVFRYGVTIVLVSVDQNLFQILILSIDGRRRSKRKQNDDSIEWTKRRRKNLIRFLLFPIAVVVLWQCRSLNVDSFLFLLSSSAYWQESAELSIGHRTQTHWSLSWAHGKIDKHAQINLSIRSMTCSE